MWLGWGQELGEVVFPGILWVEQPLLHSLMTSGLLQHCVHALGVERAQQGTMDTAWHFLYRESLSLALTSTVSPCKVPSACSQTSTGAQSKQVRHRENLLADVASLRGFCHCHFFISLSRWRPGSTASSPRPTFCCCRVISWISL
uniref:Uncharacterized protein n=1 Tax=Rousettus aegyptiacus TaxID=9407 RepID=A0A7J8D6G5_ROUAE|nr:hypothetical protein HJG63_008731 [Rousettus aegyptiacus]